MVLVKFVFVVKAGSEKRKNCERLPVFILR